jgi:DNA phosphorothioation-dependent restriction protein DptH
VARNKGELTAPENNPLVLLDTDSNKSFQYTGELAYGWGVYLQSNEDSTGSNTLISVNRQIKTFLSRILNIEKEYRIDNEVSERLIVKHLKNYITQHPYTDCLVINLFNAGDAIAFSNALVELEQDPLHKQLRYEIRLFKGEDSIIDHGEGLKNLLNPEFTVSEEAETFSQPSYNRLFPKLRFSINHIRDFLNSPNEFGANVSFVISPFPSKTELYKPTGEQVSFFLNGLITSPAIEVTENGSEIQWNKFIYPNNSKNKRANISISIFENIQIFIAGALASKFTESLPATSLLLKEPDKVLINNIHDFSDWVITFDKNLGPEIYDLPGREGEIPFLLDYVPGEEVTGISSYLTTRPTSEIVGLLGPHFKEYDISIDNDSNNATLKMLLEDLRAVSSSLIMQLNSGKNKAFEVVGAAFTKRVLEKKKILTNAFLIPIDLHQDLFEGLNSESKSRADHLLVSIDVNKRVIEMMVIEVKCRRFLSGSDTEELKEKMKEQIDNTIYALKFHFDPENSTAEDRLDRTIKNKELKSLLEFYINRALRYEQLSLNTYQHYISFIQNLDSGFTISFKELGIIFDFSTSQRHKKEEYSTSLTYFTFGSSLINEILDPESDLNTQRLEKISEDEEFINYFSNTKELSPFIQQLFDYKKENGRPAAYPENNDKPQKVSEPLPVYITNDDSINEQRKPINDEISCPAYDIVIGKTADSLQYGILGKTLKGKSIALDLNETNTIGLFGVQGGGKSYTIGTITEMMLKPFQNINYLQAPLSGVIFHYSETMDYAPEATSMIYPNDKEKEIQLLKSKYGAVPGRLEDVIMLTPADKVAERQLQFPSIEVAKIAFNSNELNVQDWMFLLGAIGNDSTYIRQLKAIMREVRNNITLSELRTRIESSILLSNSQRALAQQRLNFASHYIDDSYSLKEYLKPGRLIIVDLRDEFIQKDEALGLFVIMLNIFSGVKEIAGKRFNKFIVFDEAHKYMDNRDLTATIVTAIREMRHKGVSIMIASQDPPSLPNEIIELSSILIMHKFNSPQWLKHIQKSITPVSELNSIDLASLAPGEAFLWATKSTDKTLMARPIKIYTRPRITKHGGGTIEAI